MKWITLSVTKMRTRVSILNSFLYSFRNSDSLTPVIFFFASFKKLIYLLGGYYFTILCCFLPYIDMNQPWVYMSSPSWTHIPPHTIPQGHPSAPAVSALSHAVNLGWWSVSHMIIYMFQSYSLKSSHSHLLPQSPKICSLHPCLFCCLTYRVSITIFLNSIFMQ